MVECYNLRSVALWSRMLQRQMITNKFFSVFLPREIYRPTPLAPSCKNKHFECQCIWREGSTFISQLLLRPWALVVRPRISKLRSAVKHSTDWAYACCGKYKIPNRSSFWICFRSTEGSVPAHYAAAGGHLECLKWIHRKASKSISITVCCLRTDFELAKSSD